MRLSLDDLKRLLKWSMGTTRGKDGQLASRIRSEIELIEENKMMERAWLEDIACEGWISASKSRPHIGTGSDGEIVLEWWNEERKLTVYIDDSETTYIKSWGANIHSQMKSGTCISDETRKALLDWLENK